MAKFNHMISLLPRLQTTKTGIGVMSLQGAIEMYLTKERLNKLPGNIIKVVVGCDSGGSGSNKTVKICLFFPQLPKPCDPEKTIVLSIKSGDDSYKNINQILQIIDKEIQIIESEGLILFGHLFSFQL